MKQVFLFDKNGFYLHPIIIADDVDMPDNCTDEIWDKLYKPRRQNGIWVEGATPKEIEEINNGPSEPIVSKSRFSCPRNMLT